MSEFPYTPSAPVTTQSTSSLSHDTIVADTIPVYTPSVTPLGAFVNPATGFNEALVVTVDANQMPVLGHITRAASTGARSESGWILDTSAPLGGTAMEVAAGTAFLGQPGGAGVNQPYGFYHDGTSLYGLQLNDGAWSVSTLGPAITGLKVAYSPGGWMVLYGTLGGNLVTYSQLQQGAPFTMTAWSLPASSDVRLVLNDSESAGITNWQAASIANGQLTVAQGILAGTTSNQPQPTEPSASTTVAENGAAQVVMGFWSSAQNAPSFLYLDTAGSIYNYQAQSSLIQTGSPSVASATGFVQNGETGTSLHLYSIDNAANLWVLHQNPNTPWNEDGSPNFTQFLPLGSKVGRVISDTNPAAAPTLFAIDQSEITDRTNSVRMHRQDPQTNYWFADNMFMPSAETFDVTRFRSEISFFDSNGAPLCNYPVGLSVAPGASSADVAIAGQSYFLSGVAGTSPQPVQTDINGRLTMAVIANSGLATPALVVTGTDPAGTPFTINVEANKPIHDYLAGNGPLNPTNPGGGLPVFDAAGSTLGAAKDANGNSIIKSGSSQYVPTVAQGLQSLGQKATAVAPGNVVGFAIDFRDPANPIYIAFTDQAALDAHKATLPMHVEGLFDWLETFGGDIVHGLENAALTISSAVVDAVNNVVALVINEFNATINFAINGLEDIAHAVSAVFMWVVDAIETIIAWLKALFDLKAIWRTKTAFQAAITQLIGDGTSANPGYLVGTLAAKALTANGWFKQQQATIDSAFQALIQNFDPSATLGSQPGFTPPGPPSSSPVAGTSVSPSGCTSNVHHNWLHDKMSSGAPATSPAAPAGSLAGAWSDFESSLEAAGVDFSSMFTPLLEGLASIIENPSTIATTGMKDLLEAVQKIIDGILMLADAIVQGLATLAETIMATMAQILNAPIDSPFLQTLWDWVSGSSEPLTLLAIISLLAAFPTTIIYILTTGSEPFPASLAAMLTAGAVQALPLAAGIMQMLYAIPAEISLIAGSAAPWYLTLFNFVLSALIFFFNGGVRALADIPLNNPLEVAAMVVWAAIPAYAIIQLVRAGAAQQGEFFLGDVAKGVSSVIGAVALVMASIAAASSSPPPGEETAADILGSLPSLFSVLQASFIRNSPLEGYALAFGSVVTLVGYMGSGSAMISEAEAAS